MNRAIRAQARRASAKVDRALRRGWRPGAAPVASFGTKRQTRREAGGQ